MAIGPRLEPFPWTQVAVYDDGNWPNGTASQAIGALFNDPAYDGVQLNINLGGDPLAWSHPEAGFWPGLNEVGNADHEVTYQAYKTTGPVLTPPDTSLWLSDSFYNYTITNPTVVARYTTDDVKSMNDTVATPIVPGLRKYHGVACSSVYGWASGDSYAIYRGLPISYEAWFSQNEQRAIDTIGFNGYTMFWGRIETGYLLDNLLGVVPGTWIRRYVQGIVSRSADLTTCTSADIRLGVIITSTGTSTTCEWCINGVVSSSLTINDTIRDYAGCVLLTDGSHYVSAIQDYAGYIINTSGWAGNNAGVDWYSQDHTTRYSTSPWSVGPETDILNNGIDTYDVKYAIYVDVPSDIPVGDTYSTGPGGTCGLFIEQCNMYTHPGWTVEPDGFKTDASSITSSPTAHMAMQDITATDTIVAHVGSVHTPNVQLQSTGEVVLGARSGVSGDVITSSGPGAPVLWSPVDVLADRVTALEQLVDTLANP
jgi:hypothetical protein